MRNTGRIRMHKARENANGSFSIGKTWNFEELSAIESYSGRRGRNDEETQSFGWAGDTGFTVTLLKPYFWQTNSVQEKSYFILSLAKIYKRYTSGSLPELVGFTPTEMEQIHAYADQPSGSTARPPSRQGQGGPVGAGIGRGAPSPAIVMAQRPTFPQTRSSDYPSESPPVPAPLNARRSPYSSTQDLSQTSTDSYRGGSLRQATSRDQMRPYTSQTPPPNRLTPSSSASEQPPLRNGTPDSLRTGGIRRPPMQPPPELPEQRDANGMNGLGISGGYGSTRKANGEYQSRCMFICVISELIH